MEAKGGSEAVRCPQCGKLSRLPTGSLVTRVRCPHCHAVWQLASRGKPSSASNLGSQESGILDSGLAKGSSGIERADLRQQPVSAPSRESAVEDKNTKAPWHIWWFILGGFFVLSLVVIIGLIVVVIFLMWQRPVLIPQPVVALPQQAVAPAQPPPQPQVINPELARRGAATAAYLQGLRDATMKVLGGLDLTAILTGGAGIQNPGEKLATWEREVAALNPQDVDPLATEFKEEFAQKFRNVMLASEASSTLALQIASAPPDKMLDQLPEQLSPLALLAPLRDFVNFVNVRGPQVKAELEKRYNREMPVFTLPALGGGTQVP